MGRRVNEKCKYQESGLTGIHFNPDEIEIKLMSLLSHIVQV